MFKHSMNSYNFNRKKSINIFFRPSSRCQTCLGTLHCSPKVAPLKYATKSALCRNSTQRVPPHTISSPNKRWRHLSSATLATLFNHMWPRFCGGDIYSRRKPLFSSFGEHTAVCGSSVRQAVARPRHRQSVCIHNIHVAATCRPSVLGSATMRGHMWLNKVASVLGPLMNHSSTERISYSRQWLLVDVPSPAK